MLTQADHHHHHQQQQMMIKGKRTKRPRPASPLTISSSPARDTSSSSTTTTTNVDSGSHICNSPPTLTTHEEEDLAYCLILLAQGRGKFQNYPPQPPQHHHPQPESAPAYVYECKTCNRCFPSFQALGGHRASHKRPKLLLEEQQQQPEQHHQLTENIIEGAGLSLHIASNSSNTLSATENTNKAKVHACGICGAEFSSGQALGGHMRRHRSPIAGGGSAPAIQSASPEPVPVRNVQLCLDLNLPADEQQDQETQPLPAKFLFGSNDKTLIFTSSLVDCRY